MSDLYLMHHGVLGQRWGVRRYQPYPGTKTYTRDRDPYSSNNKKHFDSVISKGSVLTTLSYNPDRTKGKKRFYAAHTPQDKLHYAALFNQRISDIVYDEYGNEAGKNSLRKFKIDNKVLKDIKVASEDSGADAFIKLYEKDKDFREFVRDKDRFAKTAGKMVTHLPEYQKARKTISDISKTKKPTEGQLRDAYKMFNILLAADDKDSIKQVNKFTKELKKNGYGAILDVNDSLYGMSHNQSPVVIIDSKHIALQGAERTTTKDVATSALMYLGKRALGV